MENTDFTKLELDKILKMLSDKCADDETKKTALEIKPSGDITEVRELMQKTNDAFKMSVAYGSPSFFKFKNPGTALRRCAQGGRVSLRDLLDIAGVLRQIQSLDDWYAHSESGENSLTYLFSRIIPQTVLLDTLERSILPEETIADGASSRLLSIRQKISRAESKLRDTLDKMTKNQTTQKYLQDSNITMRDGRYVLPVKAEYRSQVAGLIHDTSSSGQTIFIEPMAVVEANNDIRILQSEEHEEIERIIDELCAECGEQANNIIETYKIICELELYFAKSELAISMKAFPPILSDENIIDLKKARHPLLDPKTAVPVDITLGKDYRMLIITGPNTGGKTVALKTCGLLTAMAMCGLFIPAAEGSTVTVMKHILADIGDKQSIEANLSTFSSHMTNIVDILKVADNHSLVLLDEPGTGTDPVEGAALAQSIFETLRKRGCLVMATTHYQELKIYAADTDGVENASCEFDMETLKPTYRLRTGAPGKSNAFLIAEGLGMNKNVIDYAKSLIDSENTRFEEVISKLEDTRKLLEKEREAAAEDHRKQKEIRESLEKKEEEINSIRENESERARSVSQQIIEQTKAQSNALIDELDKIRRDKEKKDFAARAQGAESLAKNALNRMYDAANPVKEGISDEDYKLPRPLKSGDRVYITNLNQEGIVSGNSLGKQIFVQIGGMRTKADIKHIRLIEKPKIINNNSKNLKSKYLNKSRKTGKVGVKAQRSGNMECDIRGMTGDEGCMEMEKFIDEAVMSGLETVTIIHGKGTGALREAVRKDLRRIKSVKSFRPGVYGEGEDGVTVVELK